MNPNISDIAKYIIGNYEESPGGITPMKLQKLLYYIKSWGMVSEYIIIPDPFEKWSYGPVNKKIYQQYSDFKGQPIPGYLGDNIDCSIETKNFINFILECYTIYDAYTLSSMTHSEIPWKNTAEFEIIKDKLICTYYKKQPFAKNFPLDLENKPFYPVQSDMDYAYIFDMDDKIASELKVYSSYIFYKKIIEKEKSDLKEYLEWLEILGQ